MDIESPYLQAIQSIAGTTPGEKQRTIHNIARQIADAERNGSDSGKKIPDVPEALKPLIRVEVSKILHQHEGIIEGLKSEDISVVSRALQAKWFFDDSDNTLVNARYFLDNVIAEISLYARLRIIKNLGSYLKSTGTAAEFFLAFSQRYGVNQAVPLLEACEEDFAFKMIIENKIILSLKMVEVLYRKYPNLVIKYLMLSKPRNEEVRSTYRIDIRNYEAFLPEVGNTRFEDFMKIYLMHDGLDIKLGKKGAKTFIKTRMNLLVEKPAQCLRLVSLKSVTQKLRDDEFRKMFKNLFPAEESAFSYSEMNKYLEYYKPEQERIPLLLNTFREVYGKDLLSCKNLVEPELITALSPNDRIKHARLQLENDKDWYLWGTEKSWRCYLPTSESIPLITKKIAITSDVTTRSVLLLQLVYTAKVNDDKDALLKVLNYVYDRHRNDQKWIFYNFLGDVCRSFDVARLSSAHWEILNKYIKWAEVKGEISNESNAMSKVLEAALHYCVLNNLPFDDYVRLIVDMKIPVYSGDWNILTEYPELEKKFLELFIEVIPKQYPFENEIWKEKEGNIVFSLIESLWNFNDRNKAPNSKFKKLSLKDYPWIFEKLKAAVNGESDERYYSIASNLNQIKKNEREVYFELLRDFSKSSTSDPDIMIDVLKAYPQRILDNWKECLDEITSTVHSVRYSPSVIVKSRWYQSLPINFFTESLKACKDVESSFGPMVILALLADGETYAKIIEPFIPVEGKLDVDDPNAKNTHLTQLAIARNLRKVNPPVSLDIIARFCIGDYLQMALRSLTSVCRRVPVVKVTPFATTLTNRPVSVMKHGVRLLYLVAPLEEIYTFLTTTWNSKSHTSIRSVVFTKIYDLFCKQPDPQSWRMIQTCLNNLNTNDDEELYKKLVGLSTVPNEYLYEYIKSVLNAMKSMEEKSENPKVYVDVSCQLIKNIDGPITRIIPEEYCQDLIKKYLFVFDYNSDVFETGMQLTIYSYLLSSKKYDESRFKFFGDFFRESVKEHWDKSHPKCIKFYPLNFMVREFFDRICSTWNDKHDPQIFESLLEIFQSALKPHQNAVSYLNLVYSIEYQKSETSVDFGTRMVQKIPELIEIFSPECGISMSKAFRSFIEYRTFSKLESDEEKSMAIIEVFANSGTIPCALFAAYMLFSHTSKKLDERHRTVVNSLRKFDHPSVAWILNERLANFDFYPDKNE